MSKQKLQLTIGHLYGDLMNIYGDEGNIITLKKRAEWRGVDVTVKNLSLKSKIERGSIDLYFFGGGQDQAQELVAEDLITSGKGTIVKRDVKRGVPLLAICGGYQLLGEYYQPATGPKIPGVKMFPAYTVAGPKRMIGNIIIRSEDQNIGISEPLVGFENHSGKTFLTEEGKPLGRVQKGFGNNGEDRFEGCIYYNALGCYMHGSLLPKNPQLADWLIQKALEVKYAADVELEELDDSLEQKAHDFMISRIR